MKPDLSFFLGGIRNRNWVRMYDSMVAAIAPYSFELVICGPEQLPEQLLQYRNIRYIRDFGSCSRAAQIAALNSEGSVMTLAADDAVYLPGSMAKALEFYRSFKEDKLVVGLGYAEGGNQIQDQEWYWKMWGHQSLRLPGVPVDSPVALNSIMTPQLFIEIGGYDTELFETCNWGGHDLIIRLFKYGMNFHHFPGKVMDIDWGPETPEHHPIYLADHEPVPGSNYHTFRKLYSLPGNGRIKTDSQSWKKAETVWSKRFK